MWWRKIEMKKKKSSPASGIKAKPHKKKSATAPLLAAEPLQAYGLAAVPAFKSNYVPRSRSKAMPDLASYTVKAGDNLAVYIKAAAGVPAALFFQFADKAAIAKEQLAEKLHLSLKTLTRYRSSATLLDRSTGEHLIRIISLYEKGYDVFGNIPAFNAWMHQPAFGLGRQIPFELIQTPGGTELVTEEVIRIEYGDLA